MSAEFVSHGGTAIFVHDAISFLQILSKHRLELEVKSEKYNKVVVKFEAYCQICNEYVCDIFTAKMATS